MLYPQSSLFLLAGALGACYAATYTVVSLTPNAPMAVVVDDHVYPLNKSGTPLIYTGLAPEPSTDGGFYYAQVQGDRIVEREAFTRREVTNSNDVYNRSTEVYPMVYLPQYLPPLPQIRRIESDLHHYNEIANIHFNGNPSDIDLMHTSLTDDIEVLTNMTYIRGNDVKTFTDVEIGLSGRSSRVVHKLSYGVKIPKPENLYGYRRLKLRALATDPSYIREGIAYRVLESAGLATSRFSYARVFINDRPIGLFGLIENYKNPWLRNEFAYGDDDYSQGTLYQSNVDLLSTVISDLRYLGDDPAAYGENSLYKINEDPSEGEPNYTSLLQLTKNLNTTSVDQWENYIDMESMLRNLALEVLLGFSDGFIAIADNYHVYQMGVGSRKFIWIPSDLDLTLGNTGVNLKQMLTGNYSTFPGFDGRTVLAKLLNESPKYKARFEQLILSMATDLVTPRVLNPLIDATVNMIRADVEWDASLPRVSNIGILTSVLAVFNMPTTEIENSKFPVDVPTLLDAASHWFYPPTLSFDQYISGPTCMRSLSGVKEFIANQSAATLAFFSKQ